MDKFKKGFIETKIDNGEYLQNPMTTKQRAEVVGRRMLLCRKKAGMSQNEVCGIIGIAPQTYSGYENGKHEPTIETLVRLSHLFGVALDFLLDRNSGQDSSDNAVEEYENTIENESLDILRTEMHLLREEVSELKKRIDKK